MVKKLKPSQDRGYPAPGYGLSSVTRLSRLGDARCNRVKGELMEWTFILAYITGIVDRELILRNEYFAAANRI